MKNGRRRKPTNQTAAAVCPFCEPVPELLVVTCDKAEKPKETLATFY